MRDSCAPFDPEGVYLDPFRILQEVQRRIYSTCLPVCVKFYKRGQDPRIAFICDIRTNKQPTSTVQPIFVFYEFPVIESERGQVLRRTPRILCFSSVTQTIYRPDLEVTEITPYASAWMIQVDRPSPKALDCQIRRLLPEAIEGPCDIRLVKAL